MSYSEVEQYNKRGIFGRFLQKKLEENFLTLGATAKILGVTKGAVQHWCSGRRKPTSYNCYQLAKLLDIPIQEFYRYGIVVEVPQNKKAFSAEIKNSRFVGL